MATQRFSALFSVNGQRPLWLMLAMVLVLGWSLLGLSIHKNYRETQESARQQLEHQVKYAEANLGRQLQITSHVLDQIRQAPWLKNPLAINSLEANNDLKNKAALLVGVRSLLVVGADGRVIASNRMELMSQNMYGSERFQAISLNPHPEMLYLSQPFLTPLKNWAMSAGKMLSKSNGDFNGYVLAILDPTYFQSMMQAIRYTEDTRATLLHGDGKVVMRQPDAEALAGQDLSARPGNLYALFQKTGQDRAIVEGTSAVSGKSLLIMFTTIKPEFSIANKSLVFSLSRETEAILAPWRQHTIERVGMALALTLLLVFSLSCRLRRQAAAPSLTR